MKDAKAQFAAVDNNAELTTAEKWQKKRELREELSPEARKAIDSERFQSSARAERDLKTFFCEPRRNSAELREMLKQGVGSQERRARAAVVTMVVAAVPVGGVVPRQDSGAGAAADSNSPGSDDRN